MVALTVMASPNGSTAIEDAAPLVPPRQLHLTGAK